MSAERLVIKTIFHENRNEMYVPGGFRWCKDVSQDILGRRTWSYPRLKTILDV